MVEYYKSLLGDIPEFLQKYLNCPSLQRLKKVGYFCGMDYASKNIYNFSEYISRYDHSLTTALITYKLTKDKKATLAGLFHDISTPCFSHVIDYMNQDYETQESTEKYTEYVLKSDSLLDKLLKEDNIFIDEIINFKNYTIVDNNRPKLCADRLDGVILTSIGWTKNITKEDIKNIIDDLILTKNEVGELEIGFNSKDSATKVFELNQIINNYCQSKEDNYMMELLSKITKLAIEKQFISYDDLYFLDEEELFTILEKTNDQQISYYLDKFKNIIPQNIPSFEQPKTKIRTLNPLILSKRLNN